LHPIVLGNQRLVPARQLVSPLEPYLPDRSFDGADRLRSASVDVPVRTVSLDPESLVDSHLQFGGQPAVSLLSTLVVQHFGKVCRGFQSLLRIDRDVDQL